MSLWDGIYSCYKLFTQEFKEASVGSICATDWLRDPGADLKPNHFESIEVTL
jgi:hypothetical protein